MMISKLSFCNIKKSFKDYAIYFSTLILGVSIFYIFNSVDSQAAMMKVTSSTSSLLNLITSILSALSVFVSFVLGFLIIYASRFLIKKRNKEFAIYMTLGMSKRKISLMILIETFLIGLISLGIGLLVGVLLSQVTSVFIVKLFNGILEKYSFVFSFEALIKTIIYFGVIYFIVMLFNTFIINKIKLINLINASKKGERVIVKDPIVSIILFLFSICLLGVAYYLVTDGISFIFNRSFGIILVPISMGIVGTLLFYYSISGIFIRLISRFKNVYYKGLNSFIFKEISSKINTMVVSMSIICIMLFLTFSLLSACMSIKNYYLGSINKYCPVDGGVMVSKDYRYVDGLASEIAVPDDDVIINSFINDDVSKYIDNYEMVKVYTLDGFDFEMSLGEYYSKFVGDMGNNIESHYLVEIMALSDYNKLASFLGFDTINLSIDEYCIINNYQRDIYDNSMKMGVKLNINNHELKPLDGSVYGFYDLGSTAMNPGFVVVSDSVISDLLPRAKYLFFNYNELGKSNESVVHNLLLKSDLADKFNYSVTTKYLIKEDSVTVSVVTTFVGMYLGIILLISSAAIMSLKELSEAIDNKNKYDILRKIGVSEKDINKSLFKQIFIFFIMPLLLGIVHTIFGIKFSTIVLSSIGLDSLSSGIISTIVFLVIIYSIYFTLTYISSKNIIKSN